MLISICPSPRRNRKKRCEALMVVSSHSWSETLPAGGRKLRCARTEAGRTGATVTTTSQLDDAASASACWLSGSTAPNGRPCPRARRRRHRACGVRPGEGSDAWERAWPAGAFQASSRRRHHTPAVRDLDFPARMQHGGDFSLVRGILTAT
jgi:hypothetical protein